MIIDRHFIRWIVGNMALRCVVLCQLAWSVKKGCDTLYPLVSMKQHHREKFVKVCIVLWLEMGTRGSLYPYPGRCHPISVFVYILCIVYANC